MSAARLISMSRTSGDATGGDTGGRPDTVAPVDHSRPTTAGIGSRGHARPVRTCIGCRERADSSDLVRLVAQYDGLTLAVVPDPRHTAPGRGAHLHPTTRCLDLAVRRRAFVRALRVLGPLDTAVVRDWVEQHLMQHHRGQHLGHRRPAPTGAGSDAETEHQLMSPR